MGKKQFEMLARVIRDSRDVTHRTDASPEGVIDDLARRLASELLNTNRAFNVSRFLDAAGVTEKV